jgi:hypothetical protein
MSVPCSEILCSDLSFCPVFRDDYDRGRKMTIFIKGTAGSSAAVSSCAGEMRQMWQPRWRVVHEE